jgi:hypothetical protein
VELILTGLGSVVVDLEKGGGGWRERVSCSSGIFGFGRRVGGWRLLDGFFNSGTLGLGSGGGGGIPKS